MARDLLGGGEEKGEVGELNVDEKYASDDLSVAMYVLIVIKQNLTDTTRSWKLEDDLTNNCFVS